MVLAASEKELTFLRGYARDLPMLFIVSEVELVSGGTDKVRVTIERAGGVKCDRCWRYVGTVSSEPAWAGLCERCQEALAETVNQ